MESLPDDFPKNLLVISTRDYAPLVSGVVFAGIMCYFLFQVVSAQRNRNIFKKLNFQGNEIEIFEQSDDSFFDKYLNEVLYLFENVKADVIVFEDMDRFDASRIFERLREINTLVNLKRGNSHVLRFFYLLRDDIFVSKDRTKFFDFIVPVVPVVDGSNSYNQFISHFSKNGLVSKFSESFLQGLSLYVDDMRLLKNICNEFQIYFYRLNTIELDYDKMLAIVTYKNLFPRDFSDLQLNKGFVFALFANKERFTNEVIRKLQEQIEDRKKRVEAANRELATSSAELDLIFKPRKNYNNVLKPADQTEYNERLQAIVDKADDAIESSKKEIERLEQEIQRTQSLSLASIITRDNIDDIFNLTVENNVGDKNEFHDVKRSEYFDLLKYLIRNAYIDETYADYMTYFYENSLSRIDKTFLRSVTDRKAKFYEYKLMEPFKVFDRLQITDFDQEETLNFSLCEYLLASQSDSVQLTHLIQQVSTRRHYEFVAQYFGYTKYIPDFIRVFTEHWPSMFVDMKSEGGFDSEQLRSFSIFTLYYSDANVLKDMNAEGDLLRYIESNADYLAIDTPNIDQLIEAFTLLDVHFCEIDYEKSDKGLLQAVYVNDLYELNFKNLEMFLKNVIGVNNSEDIRHKSYTLITQGGDTPLLKRVNENMTEYMEVLLSECHKQIMDDEAVAIALLNRMDIDADSKGTYVSYLKTPITALASIEDQTIWEKLLCSTIMLCSESNIMHYFCNKNKLDDILVNFINRATRPLDFASCKAEVTDDQRRDFFVQLIRCNEVLDSIYTQIITSLGFHYNEFSISGIDDSKMRILIDNGIIRMSPNTLTFMRMHYSSEILYYVIQRNICTYAELMTTNLFSHSELCEILSWDISDDIKLNLLEFATNSISVQEKNYSQAVILYILENNLLQDDMTYLYHVYDLYSDEIKCIVYNNAVENINQIIENSQTVAISLKEAILASENIEEDEKMRLIVAEIATAEQTTVCRYLSILGLNEYIKVFDSHSRPKFEINDQNNELLEAFKQRAWIFEYLEDDTRAGYYKIRRREQRKESTHPGS